MSRKRGVPIGSAWSPSDGGGTVRTGESTRAGAAAVRLAAGLYLAWEMTEGLRRAEIHDGTLPVAVAVRRRVVDDEGAGVPSKEEMDAVEPVIAAEVVSCVELRDRGVGCAVGVAAARASAEPVPPSMGMAKTEAKTVSAAGEIGPRPVQPSVVATKAETRATNLPGGAERPSIFIHGSCVRK